MGKRQPKYTPLMLVDEHELAIRRFEEERTQRTVNSAGDEVGAATKYAVERVSELNGIKTERKLTESEKEVLIGICYDYAIATVVASYWRKSKQVYSFSRDFYEMLLDMDDFEIGWSLFDYLPYESFYVELLGHGKVDGVLVKYTKKPMRSIMYTICGKNNTPMIINSGIVEPSAEAMNYKSFF